MLNICGQFYERYTIITVVIYDRRAFIGLATGWVKLSLRVQVHQEGLLEDQTLKRMSWIFQNDSTISQPAKYLHFLKNWAIPGLFLCIFVFSMQLIETNVLYKSLRMTGFDPRERNFLNT